MWDLGCHVEIYFLCSRTKEMRSQNCALTERRFDAMGNSKNAQSLLLTFRVVDSLMRCPGSLIGSCGSPVKVYSFEALRVVRLFFEHMRIKCAVPFAQL